SVSPHSHAQSTDVVADLPERSSSFARSPSRAMRQDGILRLQRIYGNHVVCRELGNRIQRCGGETHPGCSCAKENDDPVNRAAGPGTDGEGEERTFTCPTFAGDAKLEACLNDRDRLRVGDTGESVRKVQQGLLDDDIALPQFGADGKFGNETSTAVKEFKAKHGLGFTQFGDVGPGTMSKLDELCAGK